MDCLTAREKQSNKAAKFQKDGLSWTWKIQLIETVFHSHYQEMATLGISKNLLRSTPVVPFYLGKRQMIISCPALISALHLQGRKRGVFFLFFKKVDRNKLL